jgi:hypothetical protein
MAGAFYARAETVVDFAERCFERGRQILRNEECEWIFVDTGRKSCMSRRDILC